MGRPAKLAGPPAVRRPGTGSPRRVGPKEAAPGSALRDLPLRPEVAALPLIMVGGIIAWWGWKTGAYFGVVFLPGAIALLGLLIAMLLFAPWPGKLEGAARVTLLALLGLAAWTLTSALWSPVPDIAVSDAQRVLTYGVALALGI